MKLKKLTVQNIGPFAQPTILEVHPEVTILTGSNDTGKTYLLRVLELLCSNESDSLTEYQINNDRMRESTMAWDEDIEVKCKATFQATEKINQFFDREPKKGPLQVGDEIDLELILAPQKRRMSLIGFRRSGDATGFGGRGPKKMPTNLRLPQSHVIRSTINFSSINPLEHEFLERAFGKNATSKLSKMSDVNFTRNIRIGANNLNKILDAYLPSSIKFDIVFDRLAGSDPPDLIVNIRDKHDGDSLLDQRGEGVKKVLNLLVLLLSQGEVVDQLIILFDEPENSLHADAQHYLRSFFEELAKNEFIQVIYATHSPSMINPYEVDNLRLLERTNKNGNATSIIIFGRITSCQ